MRYDLSEQNVGYVYYYHMEQAKAKERLNNKAYL